MSRPGKYVTVGEAARILGRKYGTVGSWASRGKVKTIRTIPSVKGGPAKKLILLEEARRYAKSHRNPGAMAPPKGFVSTTEAGQIIQKCGQTVTRLWREGKLQGLTIQFGRKKHRVFINKESAEAYAAVERQENFSYVDHREKKVQPRVEVCRGSPLTTYHNLECLAARRRRLEEMGMVWPEWLRNSV